MMFLPSPSARKMVQDAPNHIQDNMIGYAQTSRGKTRTLYPYIPGGSNYYIPYGILVGMHQS